MFYISFVFIFFAIILTATGCAVSPETARRISSVCSPSSAEGRRLWISIVEIKERSRVSVPFRDERLDFAANQQARQLAKEEKVTHLSEEGKGPLQRLQLLGINRRIVGENVARTPRDGDPVKTAMEFWSAGRKERDNLLNEKFMRAGLAMSPSDSYCYIVVIFSD